ncbi:glycosyltransferase family 39 protein [Actinoplanes sp. GCM10030250]
MIETPARARTARRLLPEPVTVRPPAAAARLLPAVIPGMLMLVLGLVQAGRPVLSWDEVTSAEVAQRSLPQIWDLIQNIDAVFGFYYAFLHYWSGVVGTSEVQLRLPSILAMAGAVALAAELGRRLFTPLIGLITGLILCVLPNTSRYAAEVRPYAMACFFSVLALLLLVGAVRRGGAYRWVGYGLSVLLLGLFHLVALTTLAAHATLVGLYAWRTRRRRIAMIWAGSVIAAVVPLLPLAWLGTHQEDTQLHWVEPISLSRVHAMPGEVVGSSPVAWMLIGLAVLASWRPMRRMAPIVVLAVGPVLVLAVVSALFSPMWVARYLLVVLAPLAMLAAIALAGGKRFGAVRFGAVRIGAVRFGAVRFGAVRIVAVLLLLAAVAVPAQKGIRSPTAKIGPDYRSAAAFIAERYQPGDVVIYPPRNRAIRAGMDYYLSPYPGRPADPLVEVPSAGTGRLIAEEYEEAAPVLSGSHRIWFVVGNRVEDPLAFRPALHGFFGRYRLAVMSHPKRATVALYVLRA